MEQIISNINNLNLQYDLKKTLNKDEFEALALYFERGGLVKVSNNQSLRILYPNKEKVKKEVSDLKKELSQINGKCKFWENTKRDAERYLNKLRIKKFYDKTYWKHIYKFITDKKYKDEFEKAKIPVDLVSDPKFKKIFEEFIKNQNYRDNLIQTMDNSIIYQNKGLGEQIIESIKIKNSIADKKLELFYKRKEFLETQIKAYKTILRWVVE